MNKTLFASRLIASGAFAFASLAAHAALGGAPLGSNDAHVSSLQSAVGASAAAATAPNAGYAVNVVKLDTGTTVKEFVSSATQLVFAVVWRGPAMPDMKQVLGASFDAYVSPAAAASDTRHINGLASRTVSANGVVVHNHGVHGHFHGYAYLPALFPAGVSLSSLRDGN